MNKLENKVALVTGGSRGIGAAITKQLAAAGAKVAFTYHKSPDKANELAREIKTAGGEAVAIQANSASVESTAAAVQKTLDAFGNIDILVNNAGIYIGGEFVKHTVEDYEEVMAVNVRAVFVAALEASKRMRDGGRIVTIGSNMADNSVFPEGTLYAMSKSAVQGFTRGLARDLGPRRITVNVVQPGPIDTDMNPAESEHATRVKTRLAWGEYGDVSDIANLVTFLSSDEAKYITGAAITIDGGYNA